MQPSVTLPAGAGSHLLVPARRPVAAWLLVCCALVFAMVVVGGITRLTHSGLSIVEWQPIVGTIPPLDQAQWQEVFEKYQRTPEYQHVNRGMSLDAFKGIFWWEYLHRLLGRAIGVVFFLPLLYFTVRSRIDGALARRLLLIFILGGLQGALGWYMVKSGLVDDPRVSQYRLTAHLGMAFLIYAAMFWTALGLLRRQATVHDPQRERLRRFAIALCVAIFVMALSGGLVAGIHAGRAYNTFPLMNGHLVPPEYFMLEPWYENFFSNMAAVQFDHRLIAWLLFFAIPIFWLAARRVQLRPRARLALNLLPVALALQIALGIATLLLVVPVPLAAAHQAGALVLFTIALWNARELQ
jgi:cytochrome c oxidase assembly protein subunit 15